MPPTKRPVVKPAGSAAKRPRTSGGAIATPVGIGNSRTHVGLNPNSSSSNRSITGAGGAGAGGGTTEQQKQYKQLRQQFIDLLSNPNYKGKGISNSELKTHFGTAIYTKLVPVINELTKQSRLTMSKMGDEVYFSILSTEEAEKLSGLDAHSKMVYQVIESAGNKGIWTVDVRVQTNIQQAALTKIFKQLETRRLIKPIKAVTAKTKKLYMLYDLTPSKEITGGPWYTEYEFDHEFIAELRNFVLMCVRRMNQGKGVTLKQISDKMKQANVSRVELSLEEVQQVVQTLALDYLIEQGGVTEDGGEALFVAAKKITTMCDFQWWDVLCPDFHFRGIRFEDDVYLSAHEPHHHS